MGTTNIYKKGSTNIGKCGTVGKVLVCVKTSNYSSDTSHFEDIRSTYATQFVYLYSHWIYASAVKYRNNKRTATEKHYLTAVIRARKTTSGFCLFLWDEKHGQSIMGKFLVVTSLIVHNFYNIRRSWIL